VGAKRGIEEEIARQLYIPKIRLETEKSTAPRPGVNLEGLHFVLDILIIMIIL
jgi:hypothetical protein